MRKRMRSGIVFLLCLFTIFAATSCEEGLSNLNNADGELTENPILLDISEQKAIVPETETAEFYKITMKHTSGTEYRTEMISRSKVGAEDIYLNPNGDHRILVGTYEATIAGYVYYQDESGADFVEIASDTTTESVKRNTKDMKFTLKSKSNAPSYGADVNVILPEHFYEATVISDENETENPLVTFSAVATRVTGKKESVNLRGVVTDRLKDNTVALRLVPGQDEDGRVSSIPGGSYMVVLTAEMHDGEGNVTEIRKGSSAMKLIGNMPTTGVIDLSYEEISDFDGGITIEDEIEASKGLSTVEGKTFSHLKESVKHSDNWIAVFNTADIEEYDAPVWTVNGNDVTTKKRYDNDGSETLFFISEEDLTYGKNIINAVFVNSATGDAIDFTKTVTYHTLSERNVSALEFAATVPFKVSFNTVEIDGRLEYSFDGQTWQTAEANTKSISKSVETKNEWGEYSIFIRGVDNTTLTAESMLRNQRFTFRNIKDNEKTAIACRGNIAALLDWKVAENNAPFPVKSYSLVRIFAFEKLLSFPYIPEYLFKTTEQQILLGSVAGIFSSNPYIISLKMSEGDTVIPDGLYSYLPNLHEANIPEGIELVEWNTFVKSGIESLEIPESVKTIEAFAFAQSRLHGVIDLPASVEYIAFNAFQNCLDITGFRYSGTIEEWYRHKDYFEINPGKYPELNYIIICTDGTPMYAGRKGFIGVRSEYEIPETIILPKEFEYIARNAFSNNKITTSVLTNGTIKNIIFNAFYNNSKIRYLDFSKDPLQEIGSYAFYNSAIIEILLPDSVTNIEQHCFHGSALESFTFPSGLSDLKEGVFMECQGLTEIVIPGNIQTIGAHVFDGCTNLRSITLEKGVEKIGDYALANCNALVDVSLPDSVTEIGNHTFDHCENLTTIHFAGTMEKWQGFEYKPNGYINVICSDGTLEYEPVSTESN